MQCRVLQSEDVIPFGLRPFLPLTLNSSGPFHSSLSCDQSYLFSSLCFSSNSYLSDFLCYVFEYRGRKWNLFLFSNLTRNTLQQKIWIELIVSSFLNVNSYLFYSLFSFSLFIFSPYFSSAYRLSNDNLKMQWDQGF